jgi:hypothetical protein
MTPPSDNETSKKIIYFSTLRIYLKTRGNGATIYSTNLKHGGGSFGES